MLKLFGVKVPNNVKVVIWGGFDEDGKKVVFAEIVDKDTKVSLESSIPVEEKSYEDDMAHLLTDMLRVFPK